MIVGVEVDIPYIDIVAAIEAFVLVGGISSDEDVVPDRAEVALPQFDAAAEGQIILHKVIRGSIIQIDPPAETVVGKAIVADDGRQVVVQSCVFLGERHIAKLPFAVQ